MGSRGCLLYGKSSSKIFEWRNCKRFWGRIEYEEVEKVKYVNEPYWDRRLATAPYNYSYTFSVFDLADSISSNVPDSVYSNYTKQFAKQLTSYKNWNFSPNQLKCGRSANWTNYYKSVLPMEKRL